MKYTHIAFDVDGTMIDTAQSELAALRRALREVMGHARPDHELEAIFGTAGMRGLELLGYTPDEIARIYPRWYQLSIETIGDGPAYAGVLAAVGELARRGVSLGVVTSRSREGYLAGARRYDLGRYFHTVICEEDTRRHKPDPDPLLAFLARAGARPERTLYIGDTAYDVACAKAAGVDIALAGWGARDQALPATYCLRRPADILALV